MRLSEKTIELTFCHQAGRFFGSNMIWFGLTQEQEAKMGFDACTKLGGRLLIIQFKASAKVLKKTEERQFKAQHEQMKNLKRICRGRRAIYYAFPSIGTTREIAANSDLLEQTGMLDVGDLPDPIPEPTRMDGKGLRKSGLHYVNVKSGVARICSDEFKVKVRKATSVFHGISTSLHQGEAVNIQYGLGIDGWQEFDSIRKNFTRNALGAIIRN